MEKYPGEFIRQKTIGRGCARPAAHTPSPLGGQRPPEFKMLELQYVALTVFHYQ
jgi:hypothetical protein